MQEHHIDDCRTAPLLYSGSVSSANNHAAGNIFPASKAAIVLDKVSLLFGSFVALRNVSLTLPTGASVVLLGENGAGKSTLLRVIAGLVAPSFGSLTVLGDSPRNRRGHIALMGHATQLYDELTSLENLIFFASLHTPAPAAVLRSNAEQALREVALDPANPRRVGEYSQGMKQRTALARVLLTQPSLLLLDEPFSNLDAASAQSMIARLQQWLAASGADDAKRTLILTTHQAELARPLARTTLTLGAGQLISQEGA
jgi:ABC-type multidrug transport system ATPase subunit